jgi:hypothetical protein
MPKLGAESVSIPCQGDVMHLKFPKRDFIILNSAEAAIDLLEKRSTFYSDRPRMMVFELFALNPMSQPLAYSGPYLEWAGGQCSLSCDTASGSNSTEDCCKTALPRAKSQIMNT